MGVVEVLDPVAPVRANGWKVEVSRGERNGRVSSEWFNRPDDERYLSLDDLWASVKGRSERSRSRSRVVQTADIRVEATRDSAERLHLVLPKAHEPVAPTHWAFGQLASIVGAPASYLRQLPAPLAGINLQYGLTNHRAEQVAVGRFRCRIAGFMKAEPVQRALKCLKQRQRRSPGQARGFRPGIGGMECRHIGEVYGRHCHVARPVIHIAGMHREERSLEGGDLANQPHAILMGDATDAGDFGIQSRLITGKDGDGHPPHHALAH